MKREPNVIRVSGPAARILEKKWSFGLVFVLVFFTSYTTLSAMGIAPGKLGLPEPLPARENEVPLQSDETPAFHLSEGEGELPRRIEIPSLGIRATVANPESANVATLDAALLSGTVRYPGSGVLGEEGNVLIFGHSSHLPVVHNQAFKAFNEIQSLTRGDIITVYGEEKVFAYEVVKVEEASATEDAIPLEVNGAYLTLATCNNFGAKEDRFIVTAKLVAAEELPAE